MTSELILKINETLIATASGADAAATGSNVSPTDAAGCFSCGGMGSILIIYAALFLLLYLFMIRPQQKKRKAEEEMKKNIEVGDDVTTIGGICGRVVSIKDDESLVIETGAEKNKIKLMRWGILQNNTIKEVAQEEEAAAKKKGLFGFLKK